MPPTSWPTLVAFALVGLAFVRLVRGLSLPDRVVARDMVAYLAVGVIALWTLASGVAAYLDAALVLALIVFLATVAFAVYYVWELVLSSIRVAYNVLTPRLCAEPGIVAVLLDARTDAEITVLANLISLDDGPDALRADLKERMERRVLALFRTPSDPPLPVSDYPPALPASTAG
jgi:multisubunit Na+/H+ antiporter MnhF subunit